MTTLALLREYALDCQGSRDSCARTHSPEFGMCPDHMVQLEPDVALALLSVVEVANRGMDMDYNSDWDMTVALTMLAKVVEIPM